MTLQTFPVNGWVSSLTRCTCAPADEGSTPCAVHAVERYVDAMAARFEAGPQSFVVTPKVGTDCQVVVDGKVGANVTIEKLDEVRVHFHALMSPPGTDPALVKRPAAPPPADAAMAERLIVKAKEVLAKAGVQEVPVRCPVSWMAWPWVTDDEAYVREGRCDCGARVRGPQAVEGLLHFVWPEHYIPGAFQRRRKETKK